MASRTQTVEEWDNTANDLEFVPSEAQGDDIDWSDEEVYAVIDEQREAAAANEIAAVMNGRDVDVDKLRAAAPAVRLCLCGCGTPVVGKKAEFAPGHDMRHKGNLLLSARAGDADARATLIQRGWATDESIDAVAAKGKLSAEQRQERERQRLTAKLERAKAEVSRLEAELAALAG